MKTLLVLIVAAISSVAVAGTMYWDKDKESLVWSNITFEETVLLRQDKTGSYIHKKEIVEWAKVSVTTRFIKPGLAIYAPPICNYVGTTYLVKYMLVEWKGKELELELERTKLEKPRLDKSEACPEF